MADASNRSGRYDSPASVASIASVNLSDLDAALTLSDEISMTLINHELLASNEQANEINEFGNGASGRRDDPSEAKERMYNSLGGGRRIILSVILRRHCHSCLSCIREIHRDCSRGFRRCAMEWSRTCTRFKPLLIALLLFTLMELITHPNGEYVMNSVIVKDPILSDTNSTPPSPGTKIPDVLEQNLADVRTPLSETDTPIFWHTPRSAGTAIKTIGASCLDLVMVTEVGTLNGHSSDQDLQIIERERPKGSFVNVDTTNIPGIKRAKELGLGKSGISDLIVASHVQEISAIFDPEHRGRMFCFLRHPVERITSMFYHLQKVDEAIAQMTIEEYAVSERSGQNWLTRMLTGRGWGELSNNDLNVAKEILRKKFLIGMTEKTADSFYRFEKYFGWSYKNLEQKVCVERILNWEWAAKNPHVSVENGSVAYEALVKSQNLDVKLYEYAQYLFKEQGNLFF